MSIPRPNYTQTPNAIYDLMPEMKEAELRVTLAIVRETFGWHRETARLSITKLQKLTGLSRQGVINGTEAGIERGTILREKEGEGYLYSLHVHEVDTDSQLVNVVDYPSQRSLPPLVNVVDQQKAIFPEVAAAPKESIKETSLKKKDSAAAQTPSQSAPKKRGGTKKEWHPGTRAIYDAYIAIATEFEGPHKILWPATWECADELARMGYTAEQVVAAYKKMKQDRYWQGKNLTLMSVAKQIGVMLKDNNYADTTARDPKWIQEPTFTSTLRDEDINF